MFWEGAIPAPNTFPITGCLSESLLFPDLLDDCISRRTQRFTGVTWLS